MLAEQQSRIDDREKTRFTTAEVQRLNHRARDLLTTHFLALSADDRRLRFGASLAAEAIAAYVERIDFERDAIFGILDETLATVSVAHVAFGDDVAELGISVLPAQRGRGAGAALFARATAHARNRFVSTVFMHCLAENAAMMHIARKAGMRIVSAAGDIDAHLTLSPASPASITGECLTDRLSLYDYALKAHVAARKGINTALSVA